MKKWALAHSSTIFKIWKPFPENPNCQWIANGHSCMMRVHTKPEYLLTVLSVRVWACPYIHPYVCYITLHTHMWWGVLAFICTVVTDVTTGSFWSTGLSYMVAPRRSGVWDLSRFAFLRQDLPLSTRYHTVRSCSPTRACTGELLAVAAWQGLASPHSTHMYDLPLIFLNIHTCDGECYHS
jgi:hypothetical protein